MKAWGSLPAGYKPSSEKNSGWCAWCYQTFYANGGVVVLVALVRVAKIGVDWKVYVLIGKEGVPSSLVPREGESGHAPHRRGAIIEIERATDKITQTEWPV